MKFERQTPQSGFKIYLRLLKYVKPYIGLFLISVFGFLLFAATEPAQAKLLGVLIKAVQEQDFDARYYIPAILIFLYVVRGVGSFLGGYYLSLVSSKVVHDLRADTFKHVVYLPTRFYDDNSSGHIMARIIFNTGQVAGAATDALKTLIREGFTVIGLLAYVFYLNWQMSIVFLCVMPIVALLVARVGKRLRKLSGKLQDSVAEITQTCNEAITGHRVVRSFSGEDYEIKRFEDASLNTVRRSLKIVRTQAINSPVLQLVVIIAMSVIVFLVLQPAFLTTMSIDNYVAYLTAVGLLPKPLKQLSEVNAVIQSGIAAAESVFEIMDLERERNTGTRPATALQGKITIKNLTFRYPETNENALENINLQIEPGQTVALVGRSGSGKSTLASLIARFYQYEQGELLIDDIDVKDYDVYSLRERISVVTQSVTLFNDTISNNIAYGRALSNRDQNAIVEAARSAYALDFIQALPQKFDTLVGENGVKLSGGQKQRIAIARALLKDAPILVLDEATSALDNESERAIQRALEQFMINRTTVVIAHRLSTIISADIIVVMDHGKIVEQGTHEQLIAKAGYYARLYEQGFNE